MPLVFAGCFLCKVVIMAQVSLLMRSYAYPFFCWLFNKYIVQAFHLLLSWLITVMHESYAVFSI